MTSRLKRNHIANGYSDTSGYAVNILIPDIDKKINPKDKVNDISYGPSISREWIYDQSIDNPEWGLQSSFTKKL